MDSTETKQVSAGNASSSGSGGECVSLPFPVSRGTCTPWLVAPSSIFKASSVTSSNLSDSDPGLSLSHLLTDFSASCKDSCSYFRCTWIH